ncbi:MAG: hypothetical protein E6G23_00680 [Actinobacteria bacterium]|nr:MAG: hypothetical protein E6G23_00680 [Actinomycetota bacterium]
MLAQPRDGGVVVGLLDVHRVVDVNTTAACRDPDLRRPEPDPGPCAGHYPDAILGAQGDREAEHARVEALRGVQVEHLEHELVDAGDGDPAHGETTAETPAR